MRRALQRTSTYPMLRIPLLLILGLALLSATAYGQGTASIVGTVTDPSGAAVASAKVTITQTETGFVRSTATNATGSYAARELPIGLYNVQVEAAGFKTFRQTGVTLSVNDTIRADAALQVGETKDSITVEATALRVQADSNEISQTVTGTMVSQLATNGRNVIQLAALVTGAASNIPDFDSPMAQNQNRSIQFNGQRSDHNNWIINGGEAYDRGGGGILIVSPSQDALQEFRVLTSNYGADLGQSSGGMITMVTKSGTKQFHGSAWEYVRNDAFDANRFFSNLNGQPKPQLRYNTFGFNLGGPVPLPGAQEKKTFFFYNMEWRRLVQGGEINANAVSAAQRTGDFSSLSSSIRVPNTSDPAMIAKFAQFGLTPGQNFPGNTIPSGLIDSNAQAVLDAGLFPAANTASGRYYASAPNRTNYREEAARVDHQFNDKLNVMGSLIYDHGVQSQATPLWTGSTYPTVGSQMAVPSWQAVVHVTSIISPALLNEAAFNLNGNNIDTTLTGNYQRPSGFNSTQFFGNNPNNKLPTISIGSPYSVSYDPGNWPWSNTWRSYQWRDDVSWTHGRHNVKFGFSYMRTHKNQQLFGNVGGNFSFDGSATGNGFADFLLGFSNQYSELALQDFVSIGNDTFSAYAMDDWRVTNRLTLNLGVRWEGLPHAYDTNNRASNFYPDLFDVTQLPRFIPGTDTLDANGPGLTTVSGISLSNVQFYLNGVGLAGRNGIPQGLVKNYWNTFAPRVGLAFDLTGRGKTILRGGFGMFYERLGGNEQYTMGPNVPFSYTPQVNYVYLSDPSVSSATGLASSSPLKVSSITAVAYDYKIPTAIQYSLGVQQQLRENAVFTVSYVGNGNYHQSQGRHINTVGQDLTTRLAACGPACGGPSIPSVNVYRQYYGWAGIAPLEMSGNTNYNSLQASLRITNWKNLTLNTSYTWSHAIDVIDGELFANISNPFDARYDRGSAGFDRRHVLVMSFIYNLPFFRNASNPAARMLLGGWELSGIASFFTGNPVSIAAGGADTLGYGGGTTNRANLVAPVTYPGTRFQWFSTASFARPSNLQWGNSARGSIVGPGRNNWNVALFKAFQVKEGVRFEFRAETFNTFNHTQFTGLGTTYGNSNFGQLSNTSDPRIFQLGAKFQF